MPRLACNGDGDGWGYGEGWAGWMSRGDGARDEGWGRRNDYYETEVYCSCKVKVIMYKYKFICTKLLPSSLAYNKNT